MKSIRIKLLLVFLFIGLLPALTIGFISIRLMREAFYHEISDNLTRFSESKEGQIYAYFDAIKQQTVDLSLDNAVQSFFLVYNRGKSDALKRASVENFLKKNQDISSEPLVATMLLDETGFVIASTAPEYVGVDESKKEYFEFGKRGIFWTDTMLSLRKEDQKESEILFAVGAAVLDDERGGFLGVIVNFYTTKQIQDILSGAFQLSHGAVAQNAPSFKTLRVYLVNKKGQLLFSASRAGMHATPPPLVLKDAAFLRSCLFSKEERIDVYTNYAGEEVIGASECFPMAQWVLFTEVDTAEAFSPIHVATFRLAIITELFALFITIISLLFSQRITRPLKLLSKKTAQVALGNFHVELEHIQSKDEIGQLSEDFNQMAKKLMGFYTGLEQKISDRTQELESKVKELERLNRLMVGRELKMIDLKKKLKIKEKK